MVTFKDTQKKTTTPKRNIKVEGVSIKNGQFVDEDGNIADGVFKLLPAGVNEFTIKISIELSDGDDE